MGMATSKHFIYFKIDENGLASKRRFTNVVPMEPGWVQIGKSIWDQVRPDWTAFKYVMVDGDLEVRKLPIVKLIVSTNRVESGGEFSVRVDPVDILPEDDKTIATVMVGNTKYDLEIGDDMVIIEATEPGLWTITLDDPDVKCINSTKQAVMVIDSTGE